LAWQSRHDLIATLVVALEAYVGQAKNPLRSGLGAHGSGVCYYRPTQAGCPLFL